MSGTPSKSPPVCEAAYCPTAPVKLPRSNPPFTVRQRLSLSFTLVKTEQSDGSNCTMRGGPAALRILAVTLFGRCVLTRLRNCSVSIHWLYVLFVRWRSPSYEKKKKSLFFPL